MSIRQDQSPTSLRVENTNLVPHRPCGTLGVEGELSDN